MRHTELFTPFTRRSIERIREILNTIHPPKSVSYDIRTNQYLYKGDSDRVAEINSKKGTDSRNGNKPREAAVLLGLTNFQRIDLPESSSRKAHGAENDDSIPGILFQVRAGHMRMHAGEVSFPGGKRDPNDKSLYDTALRETSEELGIHPEQVEYLGQLGDPEISLGGLLVHVFVGYIHASNQPDQPDIPVDDGMKPLNLASLTISPEEVLNILPVPFHALLNGAPAVEAKNRFDWRLFRGEWAYRVVAADDLAVSTPPETKPIPPSGQVHEGLDGAVTSSNRETAFKDYHKPEKDVQPASSARGTGPNLEIWGLTGWFLNVFMWRLGAWRDKGDALGKLLEVEGPEIRSRL